MPCIKCIFMKIKSLNDLLNVYVWLLRFYKALNEHFISNVVM